MAKLGAEADQVVRERMVNMAAYYISQVADDFKVEARDVRLYQRLEEADSSILH